MELELLLQTMKNLNVHGEDVSLRTLSQRQIYAEQTEQTK